MPIVYPAELPCRVSLQRVSSCEHHTQRRCVTAPQQQHVDAKNTALGNITLENNRTALTNDATLRTSVTEVSTPVAAVVQCTVCGSVTQCRADLCSCLSDNSCSTALLHQQNTSAAVAGCQVQFVWSCLRVLKLYLSTDSRSTFNTASVPHYAALCKLLTDVSPYFPGLADDDTQKLLSRLP